MAGSKRSAKGSLPKRSDSATQAEPAPGTVPASQRLVGIVVLPLNRPRVQPSGDRPEALRPWSLLPSQIMAKASLPIPLLVGSTTVSVIAVASAASTAFPPLYNMLNPACAASGCDVATALRTRIGMRCEG